MATRALINIVQRQEGRSFSKMLKTSDIHTQLHKHYDGYPSGLGVTLANYLSDYDITNGIPNDYTGFQGPIANGIGCLAAQLVSYLKDEPGNIYLRPPQDKTWEDYIYYIWVKEGSRIMISIFDYDNVCIYVGDCESLIEKYEYDR
tara:strand:- start:202 stop:639 length:438 start_codon:yes stop_codon:yes gene_type:complete